MIVSWRWDDRSALVLRGRFLCRSGEHENNNVFRAPSQQRQRWTLFVFRFLETSGWFRLPSLVSVERQLPLTTSGGPNSASSSNLTSINKRKHDSGKPGLQSGNAASRTATEEPGAAFLPLSPNLTPHYRASVAVRASPRGVLSDIPGVRCGSVGLFSTKTVSFRPERNKPTQLLKTFAK